MNPAPINPVPIREGDTGLCSTYGTKKEAAPDAVYYDITWVSPVGSSPSNHNWREVFEVVRDTCAMPESQNCD